MIKKEVKENLQLLYGAKCCLTNMTKELTYHHIKKKCDGGQLTINNGALLERSAHSWLHKLEHSDINLYREINDALKMYKVCVEQNQSECLDAWQYVQKQILKRL